MGAGIIAVLSIDFIFGPVNVFHDRGYTFLEFVHGGSCWFQGFDFGEAINGGFG